MRRSSQGVQGAPNQRLEERARLGHTKAVDELEPKRLQTEIDGGGAHRQQLAPHERLQTQRVPALSAGTSSARNGARRLPHNQPLASAQTRKAPMTTDE